MSGPLTRTLGLVTLALGLALPAHLAAQPGRSLTPLPIPEADNHQEYMVAMRDGVELATSVYTPEGDGPWPLIVERTPYSKARGAAKGQQLTAAGYVYVHQDSRGRFRSQGVYEPYQTDIEDGYDTIEWAAEQAWLRPGGGVSRARPTADTASVSYVHDPDHPVPTFGGANYNNNREFPITVGPVDQRQIGERPDYLRFHSAPLELDLHVQGRIDVELWVATDAPDTDFMVKLVDVYPDGYEAVILDTALRARFRYGREPGDVEMMKPGRRRC